MKYKFSFSPKILRTADITADAIDFFAGISNNSSVFIFTEKELQKI